MPENKIERLDKRIKWALLIVSLATLVLLIASALKENVFVEWRSLRLQYAKILEAKATDDFGRTVAAQFEVGIDHNVVPELNTVDRCITCHVGLDDPRMTDQEIPFRTHPGNLLNDHPPERFGCTVCHQGQGRATDKEEAHGHVEHWPYPMLGREYLFAACGRCHDDESLYGAEALLARSGGETPGKGALLLIQGKQLVEEKGCLGCHKLNGRGGLLGPDITYVGDKTKHGFDFTHFGKDEPREVTYWLRKHFLSPREISPTTVMPDMGLDESQADALTAYVLSLRRSAVPAAYRPPVDPNRAPPAPPSGEALYGMLCSSCHGANGEASEVPGIRTPALNNRDSLAVASDDYYRSIIRSGRKGTNMPGWGPEAGNLGNGEIDRIVEYIRGWEKKGANPARVGARAGNAVVGKAYYRGLCANCHGTKGEGGIGNTLNSPTFLAIASDEFLARTIIQGRPGTAMASWKHLPAQAVSDILAHIRSWQKTAPTYEQVRQAAWSLPYREQARVGRVLYQGNCASCHGRNGEGGIGLSLRSPDLLSVVDDEFLFRSITEGRPTTAMPAWKQFSAQQIASIIRYLRSWQTLGTAAFAAFPGTGDYALGEVHYKVSCVGCHGEEGRGGVGPQLANPAFLSAVSDDTLYRWIAHGRSGTAMKGFLNREQGPTRLKPGQIADVIAYLRYLGSRDEHPILRSGVGDPKVGGGVFRGSCAGCHGVNGEGASGPQLNNPTFLASVSDGFLAATIVLGRTGTPMRSMIHGQDGIGQIAPEQVQDVIGYLRLWDVPSTWRDSRPVAEMSDRAIISGGRNFAQFCAGCHGPNGKGVEDGVNYFAPALNNQNFLNAASDGFLLATIARGRSNTPMRPFGQGAGGIASLDVGAMSDIVSFIRAWQENHAPKGELQP